MKKMKQSLFVAFLLTIIGALLIGGVTMDWFTGKEVNEDNSCQGQSGKLGIGIYAK
jgi:hypothetical protein